MPFIQTYYPARLTNALVHGSTANVCAHGMWTMLALEDDRAMDVDEGATPMVSIREGVLRVMDHLVLVFPMWQYAPKERKHRTVMVK